MSGAVYGTIPTARTLRIETNGSLFDFSAKGMLAEHLVVRDRFGDPIDICAWDMLNPKNWWLQRGDAVLLGEKDVAWADDFKLPLILFACPYQFVRSHTEKMARAVVLDWTRFDPKRAFAGVPKIICASDQVRRSLNNRLAVLAKPDFDVVAA